MIQPLQSGSRAKGMTAMVLAMALFVANDTFLKLALRDLPVAQSLSLRSLVAAVVFFALAVRAGELRALPLVFERFVLARSLLDALTTFVYISALAVMPIANSTAIYLTAPLITTALAVPLLRERVGWRRWCAILVGFLGALIVTKPEPSEFQLVALLPLAAAFFASLRDIGTRAIGMHVSGNVVGLSAALMLAIGGVLFAPWEPWRMPSGVAFAQVIASGVTFSFGTLLLVYAFRNVAVATISPLRYLLVFGALFSGYFVFGDVPDMWAAIGMALVVAAGLYSIHREQVVGREAAREEKRLQAAAAAKEAARMGGLSVAGSSVAGAACAPPRD